MGFQPGLYLQIRFRWKSSVRLKVLHLVWSGLNTLRTCCKDLPDLAHQSHLRVAGSLSRGIQNSGVYWSWPKRAMFPSGGRAEQGVCHTCMTGLISGSIAYQPEPLERPNPGNVLVCCSQPSANVILDL